ncbi:MAG: PAS domain S-box protein [Balneolaceae bacterium]
MFDKEQIFHLSTVKVVFIYLLISILWIVSTDRLLEFLVSDPAYLTRIQTLKGWFFVMATSVLLFWLIKRLNQSSDEQLDRMQTMFNNVGIGILNIHDGKIVNCNRTVARFLNCKMEDFNGMEFKDLILPNHQSMVLKAFNTAQNRSSATIVEALLLRENGTDMWGQLVISESEYLEKPYLEVILVDITERRRYQERAIRAVIEGSEQERKRVSKELHDGLAQYLTAVNLNFESLYDGLDLTDKKRLNQFE